MIIRITGTPIVKTLESFHPETGEERTHYLIGADDFKRENEFVMDEDEFKKWHTYLQNYDSDEKEIEALANELGVHEGRIVDRINEEVMGALDHEEYHKITQKVLAEIRRSHSL